MLTRRDALIGAMGAGVLMQTNTQSLATAAQPKTAVSFDVPAGACDCHTHIHGDPQQFPFFAGRVYTPETALPEEMAALHRALNIKRVVIVTPSVYGTDNSATLYGMKARGEDARGVAVSMTRPPTPTSTPWARRGCAASVSISQPAAPTILRSPANASRRRSGGWRAATGTSRSTPRSP
jgi:Amidohydrolase